MALATASLAGPARTVSRDTGGRWRRRRSRFRSSPVAPADRALRPAGHPGTVPAARAADAHVSDDLLLAPPGVPEGTCATIAVRAHPAEHCPTINRKRPVHPAVWSTGRQWQRVEPLAIAPEGARFRQPVLADGQDSRLTATAEALFVPIFLAAKTGTASASTASSRGPGRSWAPGDGGGRTARGGVSRRSRGTTGHRFGPPAKSPVRRRGEQDDVFALPSRRHVHPWGTIHARSHHRALPGSTDHHRLR